MKALVLLLLLFTAGVTVGGQVQPLDAKQAKKELAFGIEMAQRYLWREAIFRFERAVALDFRNARAWNALAVAHERFGEIEKARAAYKIARSLAPSDLVIEGNYEAFSRDHPQPGDDGVPSLGAGRGAGDTSRPR